MLDLFCWWFNAYPYTLGAKHLNVFCKMMNNSISMWFSINEKYPRLKLRNKYLIERNHYRDNFRRNFVTILSNLWPCFCKNFMLQPILVTRLSKDCVEPADGKAAGEHVGGQVEVPASGRSLCREVLPSLLCLSIISKPRYWGSSGLLVAGCGRREKYFGNTRVNRETWYFSNAP